MKTIDINAFENLSKSQQTEIKKEIINENALESIPVIYLPTPVVKEYYFISYSHKNYKEVYSDLFDLEAVGFSFWYDRGIPAGSNWKDIAIKYLEPFDCKGVVFYISEEALLSAAIKEEIQYTLENEKPFIVVYLGQDKSLMALIKRLYKENKINKDTYDFYVETFPEEIIYLKYHEPAETKKEKILNSLPKQKLLALQSDEEGELTSEILTYDLGDIVIENKEPVRYITLQEVELDVDGSNNYYIKDITASDFMDVLSLLHDEKYIKDIDEYDDEAKIKFTKKINQNEIKIKCVINKFAFANLKYLESVELPINVEIDECGFGRTARLKDIKFVDFGKQEKNIVIGDFAFSGCERLAQFDFSHVSKLGEGAFKSCHHLKSVKIGKEFKEKEIRFATFDGCLELEQVSLPDEIETIGESAFYLTAIKNMTLPKELKIIRSYAFSFCKNLKKIIFNDGLEEIDDYAFYFSGGINRWEISLPRSLKRIGKSAFTFSCLKKINFDDTYERFMEISKECFRLRDERDMGLMNGIELVCVDKRAMIVSLEDEDAYFWNN